MDIHAFLWNHDQFLTIPSWVVLLWQIQFVSLDLNDAIDWFLNKLINFSHLSAWGVPGLGLGCPHSTYSWFPDFFLPLTAMFSFGILSEEALWIFFKFRSFRINEVLWGEESALPVSFSYQLLEFSFRLFLFFSGL